LIEREEAGCCVDREKEKKEEKEKEGGGGRMGFCHAFLTKSDKVTIEKSTSYLYQGNRVS
jgi:hypothetical protein